MKLGARISVLAFRSRSFVFVGLFSVMTLVMTARTAIGQTNSLWSGNVVCTLNDQDANYFRQETQTWTLTGGAPTPQGAMQIYPATWTATGQGQRQIVQGTQTTNVQWSLSGSVTAPAQIDIFIRASDNRLIIKPWHTQLSVPNAVIGTRQVLVNGAVQSSNNFSHSADEWQFPHIEAAPTDTSVSGSTQSQADAGGAEIVHHYGGVPPSTVCEWKFTKGGAASTPQTGGSGTQNPGAQGSSGPGTTGSGTQNPPTGSGTTQNPPSTTGSGTTQNPTSGSTSGAGSQNTGGATSGTTGSTAPQNPSAPSNVIATAGDGSVSLSWTAPSGSSIGGYTVLILPTGTSINTSATSITVPGLTNGSTYMFQVVAVSAQGTKSAPATSNAVTPMGATAPPPNVPASTPAPTNVTATAGDALATVSWTAPAGVSIATYAVQALPSGSSVNTGATSITVPGLTNGSTYMFQVTATSAQGVQSAPAYSNAVTPVAAAVAPTGTMAAPSAVATGSVLKVPSTPVVTAASAGTSPATPAAPVLKPVPGVIAAKPITASTPAPASGSYLITLSALQCLVPTRDDPLNRDGTGDEIYSVVFVRQYDRKSGQALNAAYPQTRIYGDLTGFPDHNFPDRIQAGTHSASGGIQSPNFIPDGANPFAKRTLPPQADQFPLKLWQGTLADNGDVLILSPSIWESDGDMTVLNQWIQNQVSLTSSLFVTSKVQNQITSQTFGTMVLGVSESVAGGFPQTLGASAVVSTVSVIFGLPPFELLFYGTGKDRPIGLNDGSSVTSTQAMLPNTTLVLTREIIENQVLRNGQTYSTLPIQFTDKANFGLMDSGGTYMMFLQIERQ